MARALTEFSLGFAGWPAESKNLSNFEAGAFRMPVMDAWAQQISGFCRRQVAGVIGVCRFFEGKIGFKEPKIIWGGHYLTSP